MNNNRTTYMTIIDELVSLSNKRGYKNISEKGIYSKAVGSEKYNDLIQNLSVDEREILIDLLMETQVEAIHSVLASLSWWIDCKGLNLHQENEKLDVDISGMGLHGDYIGRLQGWEWPEN